MLDAISRPHLQQVLYLLEQAYWNSHRIFIMGNGGSAATASHFALDLAKNTIVPAAPRLKAISLKKGAGSHAPFRGQDESDPAHIALVALTFDRLMAT